MITCKRVITKKFLISLILLLTAPLLYGQSSDPHQVTIKNKYLEIHLNRSSGFLSLNILKENSEIHYSTKAYLIMDNVLQHDFEIISDEPLIVQNKSIKVLFNILNERAVALDYTGRIEDIHEYEFHLENNDETEYYGMGERFNSINHRGYILPNNTDDRYGVKGVGTHKPVPFFMSNQGLGVWVDSYAPGIFDLSGSERFDTKIALNDSVFRIVFISGEKLTDILKSFTELTGRPSLPPEWAFGLWKSRNVHHNQDSVYTDIRKLRSYRIPASVLVLDSPWETGYNNFKVNTRQFSDPEKMFSEIKRLGFNLCLWLTPFINKVNLIDMEGIENESDNFAEAEQKGFLIKDKNGKPALSEWWKGTGGLIDFTNPEAVDWWYGQMIKMLDYGVKAFKCDAGEGNFVPEAVFYDGTPAYKMKNKYSLLYDSVMHNFIDTYLNGDGVLITRSGYTGFQKYPFAWAGDNDGDFSIDNGLPSVIIAGQNAALSGISLWGSDVAGYAGIQTKELFIRWTQFAVFCPFMQVHMTSNLGPWDFDEETLDIFRKFAVLRIRLFPYLYNNVHEAVNTGIPVIRPMALSFQDDEEAKKNIYQFMFGNDILVAPVYQPGNFRTIYLPEGEWIDFWSGEILTGKKYIGGEFGLDKIPVYIRSGSIIPLLPDDIQTLVPENPGMDDSIRTMDDRRILQIWPGFSNQSGEIKTWDGISANLKEEDNIINLRFVSEIKRPLSIEIMFRNPESITAGNAGIYYDKAARKTIIHFDDFKGEYFLKWRK